LIVSSKYLLKTHKESVISKQIVRNGTSIGANINEVNYGSSKADFIAKMQIAQKETAETESDSILFSKMTKNMNVAGELNKSIE